MASIKDMEKMAKKAHKYADYYDHIGVRSQTEPARKNQILKHRSNIWVDGEITYKKLSGVSAIKVKVGRDGDGRLVDYSGYGYPGNYILLLGVIGNYNVDYGEDPGEIIMQEPIVLEVTKVSGWDD